ncbi:hypothetical protein BDV96DRAFT_654629 [Lophiotrema nucula]|uniref:Uncharacterized protein n=1 Tax=Lophiotrema nucula TaxID=690887 RepID=A0A6A5YI37_9PLEO|nr:hypothetical protein BDV96DRAFT_654629 [Lophiotrema nucula]
MNFLKSFGKKHQYPSLTSIQTPRERLEVIVSKLRKKNKFGYGQLPENYDLQSEIDLLQSREIDAVPPEMFLQEYKTYEDRRAKTFYVLEDTSSYLADFMQVIQENVEVSRSSVGRQGKSLEVLKCEFHDNIAGAIVAMKALVCVEVEEDHRWMLESNPHRLFEALGAPKKDRKKSIQELERLRQNIRVVGIVASMFEKIRENDSVVVEYVAGGERQVRTIVDTSVL